MKKLEQGFSLNSFFISESINMKFKNSIVSTFKVLIFFIVMQACEFNSSFPDSSLDSNKKIQVKALKLKGKIDLVDQESWKILNPLWRVSCGVVDKDSYKKISNDAFKFKIDVNDIGRCTTDRRPYKDEYLQFNWSERQEINSAPLGPGIYEFSAKVTINTEGPNAYRNTIFQIHDFRNSGPPPSYLQVYGGKSGLLNRFRLSYPECLSIRCRKALPEVPKEPFDLKVLFEYNQGFVITRYYIDDKFLISGGGRASYPIYVKIGIYRILGKATTIQTYENIKLRKLL